MNEKLKQIPKKEKYKLLVFDFLHSKFDFDKEYSEKEINNILKKIYPDFAILRRFLVDYGYLSRENDGSIYIKKRVVTKYEK
ncbi:DUF2087 domain-containing protein [Enterococcus faecium]|nr:DUF2087 domain-containing protein [Enterococcus faecium]EGP4915401.1 DUF2087 domain-containing protein [Enterococcus faecium]EGP5747404.1 DUF2087 domain-containing protein [Enterococcus faecium]EME3574947.1 DUF2087 domain-containing protein [Enterococcus faecium]EME8145372.1 DUF2087 domain-containing protein [Enterococcus faecium]MCC4054154.1 DUF2087 domain-containing protein [Enterococcus faecium]